MNPLTKLEKTIEKIYIYGMLGLMAYFLFT